MSINLKILIPDDSTCLGSIGGEGGVGQSIFGNNDNHNYSDYSALGVETVETILMRILYLKNARSAISFVTSKTSLHVRSFRVQTSLTFFLGLPNYLKDLEN